MDLELNVLNTNEIPGIVVLQHEYSYEELVDIINEQNDTLTLNEFEQFCDKFETELNNWNNIFVLNGYISEHGVDQAVEELFGSNEGIIGTIKDAVVSFAKWLWKKLKELCNWIKKLFDSKIPENKPIKESSVSELKLRLMYSKSSCDKVLSELKTELSKVKATQFVDTPSNDIKNVIKIETDPNRLLNKESLEAELTTISEIIHKITNIKMQPRKTKDAFDVFNTIAPISTHCRSIARSINEKLTTAFAKVDFNKIVNEEDAKKLISILHSLFKTNYNGTTETDTRKQYHFYKNT